jgi:hypothetical protein
MAGRSLPAAWPWSLVQTVATVGTARAPRARPAALQLPSRRALRPTPAPRPRRARACPPLPRQARLQCCARAPGCPHAVHTCVNQPCGAAHRLRAAASPPARRPAWEAGRRELRTCKATPTGSIWAPGAQHSSTARCARARRREASEGLLPCPAPLRRQWQAPPGRAARLAAGNTGLGMHQSGGYPVQVTGSSEAPRLPGALPQRCRWGVPTLPTYAFSTVGVEVLQQRAQQPRPPLPAPRWGGGRKACKHAPGATPQGFSHTRRVLLRCLHGCGHAAELQPAAVMMAAPCPRPRRGWGRLPCLPVRWGKRHLHQGSLASPESLARARRGGFAAQVANSRGV